MDTKLPARYNLAKPTVRRTHSPPLTCPVYGWAAAGEPDRLIMMNEQTENASVQPFLGIEGGYALYVHGTSMMPRYFPGDLVYVHPYKPLREKDFCVVQFGSDKNNPEGAYIKQYVGWGDDELNLHQFNPDKPFSLPASQVIYVHRIVGSVSS